MPGLPKGLVATETTTTGRLAGSLVRKYEYINNPSLSAHGKVFRITDGFGSSLPQSTTFAYNALGQVSSETDSGGRVTKYYYDLIGRLTGMLSPDPDGSGPLLPAAMRYEYDSFGNVVSTESISTSVDTSTFGSNQLLVTSLVDGFTYDSQQRLTGEYLQRGSKTWYLYDSPTGIHWTNSRATALANISFDITLLEGYVSALSVILNSPVPGTLNALNVTDKYPGLVTSYVYDFNGNVKSILETDAQIATSSRTTQYRYDRLNRIDQILTPPPGLGVQ